MTRRSALSLAALFPLTKTILAWQGGGKRKSPHETISVDLAGKTISITYGRPYLKGRKLEDLAPNGQVWRMGADEATKISVPTSTRIGSELTLPPGSYSLFAIPGADKWTLVVNKVADQWGAFSYDPSKDLGRVDMPVEKTPSPVEEFTISLQKKSADTAVLTLQWGSQSVSTELHAG